MERPTDNLDVAFDARSKGIAAKACHPGTKIPRGPWKHLQERLPTEDELREDFREPGNICIVTTGMVTFDCETKEAAKIVLERAGSSPQVLQTPGGGVHIDLRLRKGTVLTNRVRICKTKANPEGLAIDIRTNGGLKMIPPSETEKGRYEWIGDGLRPVAELPVANISWTRDRVRKRASKIIAQPARVELLVRGRAYVDTFGRRAVDGSDGHTAIFVAALKISSFVKQLGGTEADAWELLLYFNATKCDPPWDPSIKHDLRALEHKWREGWRESR